MTTPHFTIVIPTRNRLATLKSALRTCLDQEYSDFTVIVASNNCDDGTNEYVNSLGDGRVLLAPVDETLRMTENWSRAMPLALSREGFVTFLGDDDGLLPGALAFAAAAIGQLGCQVLSWRKVEYAWPDVVIETYRNHFSISIDRRIEVRSSREFLAKVHEFSIGYDEGPGLYSSFVHSRVLSDLEPVAGGWFAAIAPDIFASYAIASAVREYHKCSFGLSINGASGSSTGTSYIHRPVSDAAVLFRGQNAIHPALVHAPSIYIAEADGLLVARERFPERFAEFQFSWQTLVARLSGDVASAPSRVHYDLLVEAMDKVVHSSGLPRLEVPPYKEQSRADLAAPQTGFDPAGLRFTAVLDPRLVSDVVQAGAFADSFLRLSNLDAEDLTVVRCPPHGAETASAPENSQANSSLPETESSDPPNLVRRVIRAARRHYRWRRDTEKIESWFAREADIARWSAHKELVDRAIHAHEYETARQEAARLEFEQFQHLAAKSDRHLRVDWNDRYLCLDDRTQQTGFDRHYIYHPAWAARALAKLRPRRHTDISSTLTFCSLVSAFIPVDFYDYRPAPVQLKGLNSLQADLQALPFEDGSLETLSCMHVLEHVGLGRYGDPLDADGDLKAVRELKRALAPGGSLLVAVPVGQPRVQFNAHRVYRHRDFVSLFEELELVEFALIPDGEVPNGLIYGAPEHLVDRQVYGCGCYWFRKAASNA